MALPTGSTARRGLFISWSGDAGGFSRRIAENIRDLFAEFSDTFKVYFSEWDIDYGEPWEEDLSEALRDADDGIVLFSQDAIRSDWLLHECAVLSSRLNRLTLFRLGAPAEMVPQPLHKFQMRPLTRTTLRRWLDSALAANKLDMEMRVRAEFCARVDVEIIG